MKDKNICFYLSDHGFGHIARSISIIARTAEMTGGMIYIVCGERQREFAMADLADMLDDRQMERIVYRSEHTDIGLILKEGTLLVDKQALAEACAVYTAKLPEKAEFEAEWLREHDIGAALCDMPLWSVSACEKAGVPLLYVGNFTWAELYREFLPDKIWKFYSGEFGRIKHGMLYALHNDQMRSVLKNADLRETSVAVRPFHDEIVKAIRSRHSCPVVFVAAGMSASFDVPVDVGDVDAYFYVTELVPLRGRNVEVVPVSVVNTQDYIAASDFVITKAGWTTVAECLMARKPIALFARDSVLEDRNTIDLLEGYGVAIKISYAQLNDMSDLIKKIKGLEYPAELEFYNAADEIASELLRISE